LEKTGVMESHTFYSASNIIVIIKLRTRQGDMSDV